VNNNDSFYAPGGKGILCGACAEIQEDGETSLREVLFDARGTKMELRVRGMTIAGMMNRVLQWVGARDRVLRAG